MNLISQGIQAEDNKYVEPINNYIIQTKDALKIRLDEKSQDLNSNLNIKTRKKTDIKSGMKAESINEIQLVENNIIRVLRDSEGQMLEMCMHIFKAGGKRIRPILVLYGGLMFSEMTDSLLNAATASELIHMASLVHDDIIDNSELRRSRESINNKWGNTYAVLCGDYLFAKAFSILASDRLLQSMDLMVYAITSMCHGEILQASDKFNINTGINEYYSKIAKKTAIFMECCCKSGAAAAGAERRYCSMLGEYGLNLGYAFQIIDDILDFCGDSIVMGKPMSNDLRQGNITLPVIMLLSDTRYRDWALEMISAEIIAEDAINNICDALKETGIIDKCYDIAASHISKAKRCLEMLPNSIYRDKLYGFADMLQARVN